MTATVTIYVVMVGEDSCQSPLCGFLRREDAETYAKDPKTLKDAQSPIFHPTSAWVEGIKYYV